MMMTLMIAIKTDAIRVLMMAGISRANVGLAPPHPLVPGTPRRI
jgi:hypothetical protein